MLRCTVIINLFPSVSGLADIQTTKKGMIERAKIDYPRTRPASGQFSKHHQIPPKTAEKRNQLKLRLTCSPSRPSSRQQERQRCERGDERQV
jgi:hypothetical protein